jgi:hypothetical protein
MRTIILLRNCCIFVLFEIQLCAEVGIPGTLESRSGIFGACNVIGLYRCTIPCRKFHYSTDIPSLAQAQAKEIRLYKKLKPLSMSIMLNVKYR